MPSPELTRARQLYQDFIDELGEEPTLEQMREGFEGLCAGSPLPTKTPVEEVDADGTRALAVTAPGVSGDRAIVYLHGGGYMLGSADGHVEVANALSTSADARVLVVDYRRSPEHSYPAAHEDAMSAYRWLMANGGDPDTTAIVGDSCGGGMVIASMTALRDAGEALPAAGVCISPWCDLAMTGASMETKIAEDPIISREMLENLAGAYLGEVDRRDPVASPLYGDLQGLPPLLILVGTAEVLLDDATRLAEQAKSAGTEAELQIFDEMFHVWTRHVSFLPEAQEAIARIGEFVTTQITNLQPSLR
jgi:acetyl esterase/lipase